MSADPRDADPRDAAAFAALLARTAGDILLIVDRELRIVRAGAGAAGLAERSADELIGMSLIAAFGSAPLDAVARRAAGERTPALGEADLGPRTARAPRCPAARNALPGSASR